MKPASTVKPPRHLTHAGGVVVRTDGRVRRILLVRAKPVPHDWVLPKGRIEDDETPKQAARREVQEEAGVDARPADFLGELQFDKNGRRVHAGYFLMNYVRDVDADEDREIRWCTFNSAQRLVRWDDIRRILKVAQTASRRPTRSEGTWRGASARRTRP